MPLLYRRAWALSPPNPPTRSGQFRRMVRRLHPVATEPQNRFGRRSISRVVRVDGFTLVVIMIVVVIIGLLAALAF